MKPVALIGFMGTGKTTVGQLLGEKLDKPVIDLDEKIEKSTKMSIRTIFETKGEAWFRKKEEEELAKLIKMEAIVSTGGGIVTREQNRHSLKRHFSTVWLQATFSEIDRRLAGSRQIRPLWLKPLHERKQLFLKRENLYKEAAQFVVSTDDRSVDEIAEEVIHLLQLYENEN